MPAPLILLSDYLFVQQFFNKAFNLAVFRSQRLAFFSLEHNVLDSFHLGRRAGQSALLRVAVNVGHRPLVESKIRTRLVKLGIRHVRCALERNGGVFVFHNEFCVARAAWSCASVDGDEHWHRSLDSLNTSVDMAAYCQFAVFALQYFLCVCNLSQAQFLSNLRSNLCGIAVDSLASADDDVGSANLLMAVASA